MNLRRLAFSSAAVVFTILLFVSGLAFFHLHQIRESITNYTTAVSGAETAILTGLPTYNDSKVARSEAELRRYLNADHIALAVSLGLRPVVDNQDRQMLIKSGELVLLEPGENWYFYNVTKESRVLHKRAVPVLNEIAARLNASLQRKLGQSFHGFRVRIALSSLLRTAGYQASLVGKHPNAASESSHSYGNSFDIYDDYQIRTDTAPGLWREWAADLMSRIHYLMGDAMRSQLQAELADVLLTMQREGRIYVIWEANQRCYHVSAR